MDDEITIENYTLTEEQAGKIPSWYFLGAEDATPKDLEFKSRDENRPNPTITYGVRGYEKSSCKLTLYWDKPLVNFVDIIGKISDMDGIREVVEGVLELKFKGSEAPVQLLNNL